MVRWLGRLHVTVHGPGTGSFFGPFRAEKCACPLPAQGGQSHFRLLRRENRDSPREQLRLHFADFPGNSEKAVILGHKGFLDYFTATFDGEGLCRLLEPNDSLPIA